MFCFRFGVDNDPNNINFLISFNFTHENKCFKYQLDGEVPT